MLVVDSVLNLPDGNRMLDAVRRGIEDAEEVGVAVSFTRCSGLGLLIDPLKEIASRGGRVRVLTSTYQSVTQPEALEVLQSISGVETRVQSGAVPFHAKFWWFRGKGTTECWAGSSNLSKGGLSTNLEWNVRRSEPEFLRSTQVQFETLWRRADVHELSQAFIDRYRETYQRAGSIGDDWNFHLVEGVAADVEPNAAQREALAALRDLRARGERRAAVIAATGTGKTFLAAFDVLRSGARSALYVSHRLEHLLQARRSFASVMPEREFGVVGGGYDQPRADIVFATIASLRSRPELASRAFDYLVIDEFHHVEAPSYEVLRPLRERAFLLGITATPERQDGHDVLAWCDWNIAYEVRLPEAVDRGWLLPFHYFGISDETVDFLRIPWRRLEAVEDALSVEERADHVLAHALERGFDGIARSTVGFCAGRKHATFMADAFTRRGQVAAAVLGDQSVEQREETYNRLSDPKDPLRWVFVSDVLNEGVDIPALNSIMFLRPTESAALFLQQLGRGLRLYPGTEVLTVLDFVGHHRSAWLTLNALDAPAGAGRRTEIADGVVIKPPRACEIVLQRRTREILSKISRFTSKRQACDEAYRRVSEEAGRPILPVDLWGRTDVPPLSDFRAAHKSWVACQRVNGDEPSWSKRLEGDHPAHRFLRIAETDWQAQRVSPYALLWGLCSRPEDPGRGYEDFFARYPQWQGERSELEKSRTWEIVSRKLGDLIVKERLSDNVLQALGSDLLDEFEGRVLYTVNSDFQQRHGGTLRTPDELNLFARYERPDIVRHFGVHYDPARHNTGILWFGNDAVIICKLDTSTAIARHQYQNQLMEDGATLLWTSQNRMAPDNDAGRKVLEHRERGDRIHIFVQPRSHHPACYLGCADVRGAQGANPMQVAFELSNRVPEDVLRELVRMEDRSASDDPR